MNAIALVTDSVMQSSLKEYFETQWKMHGDGNLAFHSVTQNCKPYVELFNAHQNVITWNCRMPHSWLSSKGKNVLFIENSLLCQRSGIFIDARGFFSNSNIHHDQSWLGENAEWPEADAFIRRHFKWEPFSQGNKDGPILVCLQYGPDCNLQQEFPLGKGASDKVKATLELLAMHLPTKRRVIIRPHPRFLASWHEREAQYHAECWRSTWEMSIGGDVYKLLPQCSALVSVNSTIVSEALSLGLPVATLGSGVFSNSGVTLECAKHPSRLRDLQTFAPDQSLCRQYVSTILRHHHLPYDVDLKRTNRELETWLAKTNTVSTPKHLGGHLNITHTDAGSLAWLQYKYGIRSMIDIGCGPGGMKAIAVGLGISWQGVDGDPLCKLDAIVTHDYCEAPLKVESIDLAWSVEFLEHVSEAYVENFMQTFACARYACVTHALPGKNGWHHVNCQPADYWIEVFARHDFIFDQRATVELRGRSTMKRDFMRANGLLFRRVSQSGAGPVG